ncbi:MAG: hypothetical protein HY258_10990 [Chloroflexi bacterium]|nr:hypothetical protein [Chloroflexota bacterium]
MKNDPHSGLLGTQCASCHTPAGWSPSTFDHSTSIFPLTGAHVTVNCKGCHADLKFKGTPTLCYSCHAANDRHGGRFGTNCSLCHSTSAWKPATFDHSLAAFKLTGAHVTVACEKCHVNGVFKGTPMDCYSCHAKNDRHGGKFGTNCGLCHSTTAWKPATFDHSKSNFPLTGAHLTVNCSACHPNGRYTGTPTACSACHADPSFHAGAFGLNCAACHSTSGWTPAKFGLSHPRISGGEGGSGIHHGGASCRTCHPSTVYTYTCRACHNSNNPGDGGGGD